MAQISSVFGASSRSEWHRHLVRVPPPGRTDVRHESWAAGPRTDVRVVFPLYAYYELFTNILSHTPALHRVPVPSPHQSERISYQRLVDEPGVEILSAENCARHWCVYHESYDICTVFDDGVGGQSEWTYRGRTHTLAAERIAMLEPGEVHRTTRITAPGTFDVLLVSPVLMRTLAAEMGVAGEVHFRMAETACPKTFSGFADLHALVRRGSTALELQSHLVSCLTRLLYGYGERRPYLAARPTRRMLSNARDVIHEHYNQNIPLCDLARAAGLSRFHFLRSFAREFGLPPHAYQIKLRIEKVRVLLRAGVPLAEIDAGFADQSHLIRHFKATMGVTPMQYASMIRCVRPKYISCAVGLLAQQ